MNEAPGICKLGNKSQGMGDVTAISVTSNIYLIFVIVENNLYVFLGGYAFLLNLLG